jgi:nuclear pore complex protein Nup155
MFPTLSLLIFRNPFPRHVAQGDAKLAWDQEETSLAALQALLKNVIEAISFLDLLDKYKLPDIVAKYVVIREILAKLTIRCDPDVQGLLSRMTFKDFLTTPEGRKVSRQLVTNLIEQQIGQEHGVSYFVSRRVKVKADRQIDTLSETLQRECGTFSQPGDVVVYKVSFPCSKVEV